MVLRRFERIPWVENKTYAKEWNTASVVRFLITSTRKRELRPCPIKRGVETENVT